VLRYETDFDKGKEVAIPPGGKIRGLVKKSRGVPIRNWGPSRARRKRGPAIFAEEKRERRKGVP